MLSKQFNVILQLRGVGLSGKQGTVLFALPAPILHDKSQSSACIKAVEASVCGLYDLRSRCSRWFRIASAKGCRRKGKSMQCIVESLSSEGFQ